MYRNLVQPLLLLLGLQLVAAQFDFFGNMFGGQQQQHHQQQQHRSGASQWAAYSDSVSCSSYLCPETLDCVAKPVDCPCPNSEDIKCLIPDDGGGVDDATVVCTRGDKECAEVQRLMLKGGTKSKSSKSKSKSKTKSKSRK